MKALNKLPSSNQRLRVRSMSQPFYRYLNDFRSRLSTSVCCKNQQFFNNNWGFTEIYFSDKVHVILIEEVPVQTTLRDGASFNYNRLYLKM